MRKTYRYFFCERMPELTDKDFVKLCGLCDIRTLWTRIPTCTKEQAQALAICVAEVSSACRWSYPAINPQITQVKILRFDSSFSRRRINPCGLP